MDDSGVLELQKSFLVFLKRRRELLSECENVAQMQRWRTAVAKYLMMTIGSWEADQFYKKTKVQDWHLVDNIPRYKDEWDEYLDALADSVLTDPYVYFSVKDDQAEPKESPAPTGEVVYIMYGEESQALIVQKMIREWNLEVKLLTDLAMGAATLIQKLICAGNDAAFVFVILTEDDLVKDKDDKEYTQPRPNALIELGYYLGRLGQDKVAILCTKTVQEAMASNIKGIEVGRYEKSIGETYGFVQRQLASVNLGPLAEGS